jgi:hypothetical protein
MGTVSARPVEADKQRVEQLPERVLEALGELAGAAKEGLLALSVGVGLGVLHEIMDAEVDEVVGPKGRHDRTVRPSVTAARAVRSRSVDGACRSAARACELPTARVRSSWPPIGTSLRAIS